MPSMKHITFALITGWLFVLQPVHAAAPRPNVILILADDLGYGDLSCYGAELIDTPNIDRLASEGKRFTHACTPSSVCSPTRYGLLAGRYSWRNPLHAPSGVHGPAAPLLFEADRPTLGTLLQGTGYRTAAVGKWHLGFGLGTSPRDKFDWTSQMIRPGPLEAGFDHFFGMAANVANAPQFFILDDRFVGRGPDDRVTVTSRKRRPDDVQPWSPDVFWDEAQVAGKIGRHAADYIERQKDSDQPFFLYFASNIAHSPITPASDAAGKSLCGAYGDFVQELDRHVGLLLDALDRSGKLDNTLIIFTSDNGGVSVGKGGSGPVADAQRAGHHTCAGLRGGKASIYEGGFRVPFIVRWPGVVDAGSSSDQLICLTDVLATIAEAIGMELPAGAAEDSISFLSTLAPRLAKPDARPRQTVVLHSMDGIFAIRAPRWKLIAETDVPERATRAVIIARENRNQLFDLHADPTEANDVWKKNPEMVDRLSGALDAARNSKGTSISFDKQEKSSWWHKMFSLAFDGHGNFVAPHLDTLNATAASLGAVGFNGPWDADLNRDMPWMRGHLAAFAKHPAAKRIIYIEGAGATKVLARVSADGRVLFTEGLLTGLDDPKRRRYVEYLIKPGGRTVWLGDWQFMQGETFKTPLGKRLPTARDLDLPPFMHPLSGAAIADEDEFWRTRSARPLLGKSRDGIRSFAGIPDDLAARLDLASVTTQNVEGQWLMKSGESMLYDAPFAAYQAAKARRVLETLAPDMIHYDDWDLRSPTLLSAKADIHVAAFRRYVAKRFSGERCREVFGVEKARIADFDVLHYLLNPPWRGEYDGRGSTADGPAWLAATDKRWLGDRVWRVFQIACIEDRLASMKEIYRLNHAIARKMDRDAPMVANIIPTLSAVFLQRDCVDMANFEWPNFKTFGAFPNPLGDYPQARLGIGPRMASKIGVTGHAMVDPYVQAKYSGWDGKGFTKRQYETLHKVIYFDLLANRGIPAFALTWDGGYSPGSVYSAGQLHAFLNEVAPVVSNREYLADIGLAASSWSTIAAQTPFGGWNDEVSKRHLAEFIGWAQHLMTANDFPQWDVLPFDDVRAAELNRFKLVILPSVLVVTADQLAAMNDYLRQGGRLLVTGETGAFTGPEALLMPRDRDLIAALAQRFPDQVLITKGKPGLDHHFDPANHDSLQALLATASAHAPVIATKNAPAHLGIYASDSRTSPGELTVDFVNYHHNLATDQIIPVTAADFTITLRLPPTYRGDRFDVESIRYDETAPHNTRREPLAPDFHTSDNGLLTVRVPRFTYYQILHFKQASP